YSDGSVVEGVDRAFKQKDISRIRDRAKVEALMLAQAMQAKRLGKRMLEPLSSPIITMEENLEHEVRHLKSVARAYRDIPSQWRETQSHTLDDRPSSQEAASRR
ncbi:MAG: hypothetical protein M3Z35_04230, partial [Nitrospirota bacterium]|nr:hypothetical protein [Nitrospirota bacterium]